MTDSDIVIEHVRDKKGRAAFVDVGNAFSARVPNSVPQLRSEQIELITPDKNPFFSHARVQLFIAKVDGKPVGRISAHIDELALEVPKEQGFGPGTGMFGYFDAGSEPVAHALLAEAEKWLLSEEMTRVLGPISMSIWEEPGLLVRGQDHPPMIMMGHHPVHYRGWIESYGFTTAKTLLTYDLPVDREFPPLIQRIVKSGERNSRITVRQVVRKRWDSEAAIILSILNDAWSGNWGFVPFTPDEIAHAGKKLRPIIYEPLNMIAELDGEPVAFMLTFPDINQLLAKINGKLMPFGWFHMLRWLHFPKGSGMRVPLMGVKKELHNSRMASQLAFMMIDKIRRTADELYESKRGEVGWILDDNQGMVAIADALDCNINREYIVFAKDLI
ncbi:MAG: N-acetyltransferase [Proteobacteria bacterium]|nr:N-acetyltransferase [Pseudomonadota bacterium]MDA0914747.1 N-acetyltransferase [Pseudomonadota bacterium]MDA1033676.1 N-acetyltransferase [Pseudomonadota bacterium]